MFIGGCWPGECHYVTEGNYDALGNTHLCKRLLEHVGIDPARLTIEWIAASEGSRFAEVTSGFVHQLAKLGPLSAGQTPEAGRTKAALAAMTKLVPYLKLVERERLRVADKSEQAYDAFFGSDEFTRLFDALIADKLAISQITSLLSDGPLSTAEIAETLRLSPSDVSKHMNSSSRQGLVTYDVDRRCYALA